MHKNLHISSTNVLYLVTGLLFGLVVAATLAWFAIKEKAVSLSYQPWCETDNLKNTDDTPTEAEKNNEVFFVGCGGFF